MTSINGCPLYASFFGHAGVTAAMVFSALGAAIGTVMSGGSIAAIGVKNPSLIMKALLPVIFAGILVVYGMVVSIFISTNIKASEPYSLFTGSMHLGAGLCVGLACLASGYAIGRLGDEGVRTFGKQPRFYIGLMLMMIFSEILAIYGLIVAFMIQMKGKNVPC